MYQSEPRIPRVCGREVSPGTSAMPKSVTFATLSLRRTMTFAGLRSRWITPSWCAAPMPAATWRKMASASSTGMGSPRSTWRAMILSRLSPSMYCITR